MISTSLCFNDGLRFGVLLESDCGYIMFASDVFKPVLSRQRLLVKCDLYSCKMGALIRARWSTPGRGTDLGLEGAQEESTNQVQNNHDHTHNKSSLNDIRIPG
jgi:hypothetical protein